MRILLAFVFVFLNAQAFAQTCAEIRVQLEGEKPLTALRRLAGAGCLGDDADDDAYTQRAKRLFDTAAKVEGQERAKIRDVTLSPEESRALTLAVLRIADDYLSSLKQTSEISRLRADVQQAIRDRAEGVESATQRLSYWTWDGTQASLGATGIDVTAADRASAEGLLRGARLAERAFTPGQAQAIQAAAARAATRDARWRSYFADARSQYPWELFINSRVYASGPRGERGVGGPPESQLIVLHPDIAMQYVRSADSGDRFKPALLLEVVGYNRWSWGSDNRPRNAWGASVVRTYADTSSVKSSGWGLAIHRNSKYTLTIASLGGKAAVLFSIDLAGAVTGTSEAWRDEFRVGR